MQRIPLVAGISVLVGIAVSMAADGDESGLRAYVDTGNGFAVAYASGYVVRRVGRGSYFAIETSAGERLAGGEVHRLADLPRDLFKGSRDVFRDFAVNRALTRCGADGPDGGAYCRTVYRISQTRTSSDLRIIEMYLRHVQELYGDTPERTESIVGPVYAVDISTTEAVILLLIGSVPHQLMSDEQTKTVRYIAAHVRLIPARKSNASQGAASQPATEEPRRAVPAVETDLDQKPGGG